jgi:Integrase core domain
MLVFRDELLNDEAFYSLQEARIIIGSWRRHHNAVRPASCPARVQITSTGGAHTRIRRVAGVATSTGFAGHAGDTASIKLVFHSDHLMKAGSRRDMQLGKVPLHRFGPLDFHPNVQSDRTYANGTSPTLAVGNDCGVEILEDSP